MTTLLEEAVQILRSLPENTQEMVARTIMDCASSFDEQLTEVRR